jgi:hypothetical protein
MSSPARVTLLVLMLLGFVRLSAAGPEEVSSLRAKAERGNALAQYNLGLVYVQGRQTAADPAEAFAWLTLASESGATGKALDSLLGNITDEQLAEGRRRLVKYRDALSSRAVAAARTGTPKLAPRGFSIEPVPPPTPAAPEPAAAVTKTHSSPAPTESASTVTSAPPAVAAPITTSPAEGSGLSELGETRKELEKARADLVAANTELANLRTRVAQLEAATAEAKATEARLTAELAVAQEQATPGKAVTTLAPAEKPKADEPAPPRS